MIKKLSGLALLASSMGLTGCASMGVGESDYSCPGLPHGAVCQSVMTNYEQSNGSMDEFRDLMANNSGQSNKKEVVAQDEDSVALKSVEQIKFETEMPLLKETSDGGLEIINNPYITKATPEIIQPTVSSVWFSPRVGKDRRYYGSHYVYFVKGATHWKDSQNYVQEGAGVDLQKPKIFKPLQVVKSKRTKQTSSSATAPTMNSNTTNIFK